MNYLLFRILSSFLVGVLSSQTGSLIQLGTKNVMASPSTLGLDGLAILWLLLVHTVSLWFGINPYPLYVLLLGIPVFYFLANVYSKRLQGTKKYEKIILLGISFNLLVGAIFSLWHFLFLAFNLPFPTELWFGHFKFASHESFIVLIIAEIFLSLALKYYFKKIQLFSLGTDLASLWGLDEKKLYRFIFVASSLVTFMTIQLFGSFSFLALILPIISRKIWMPKLDLEGEFFLGALLNGIVLMILDLICYLFPIWGAEIPAGLIITTVGALGLLSLLWMENRKS